MMLLNVCRILAVGLMTATLAYGTHYRVYLLGGQSNGNGRGDAAQLTGPLASAQTDVRFYWHRTQSVNNVGHLAENAWIDLAPGSGHGTTTPVYPKEFGSELSFGRAMADADPAVNIAIIKYTHGGTNLHTQWAEAGPRYASFLSTVRAGLLALEATGDTYELGGMIWHQGEADTGSQASQYEGNLGDLIERVRSDVFGGKKLPFVIGSISDSQYGSQITTPGTGAYQVRKAQEDVAADTIQVGFVNTDGYSVKPTDTIHFNEDGQIAMGNGFASQMLALEANDADRDGLLLEEENDLGTSPNNADTDGDGQEDGFEVLAGTNPVSAASFFAITAMDLTGPVVTLTWPSLEGNLYEVEYSADLISWRALEGGITAVPGGSQTQWGVALDELNDAGSSEVVALYDVQAGSNGSFNTIAFDSVDDDGETVASRLVQGGSLTGGGSSSYVLDNGLFDTSASGSPGFNLADVTTASQIAADSAGDWLSFTLTPGASPVTYDRLSFFADQFDSGGKIDISYRVGEVETFILQGYAPPGGNAPVALRSVDFPDFTSAGNVTWTFYLYGASSSNYGTRLDDITLFRKVGERANDEVPEGGFFRVGINR